MHNAKGRILQTRVKGSRARWLAPELLCLLFAGATAIGQVRTANSIVDQFDTNTSGSYVNQAWGTAVPVLSWAVTVNQPTTLGPNNSGSGSLFWSINWSTSNGSDQVMVVRGLGTVLDLRPYTNISFDVRFDPTSGTDGNGSFGGIELDWVPQSDGWPSTYQNAATFASANTNWVHVSFGLDARANAKLQAVTGIGFKLQQKKTGSSLSGVSRFWLDNLILTGGSNPVVPPVWSTVYYGAYNQAKAPASEIDFTAASHWIHFAAVPNSDGSLDLGSDSLTIANSIDVIRRAHAAGRKVLVCLGGGGTAFRAATNTVSCTALVSNIVSLMSARGYDGIDIDWEPLNSGDLNSFTNFVTQLYTKLGTINPRPLLTAAVAAQPGIVAKVCDKFDQINIMTYDNSGTWLGETWFNSPIYSDPGSSLPSCDSMVASFENAGIPASKLGIGITLYGYIWTGGSGTSTGGAALPRQTWSTAPGYTTILDDAIMTTYYQSSSYHWDAVAQSAYLSIDNSGTANDKFITYDDEHACQAKVSYARNNGLGGVMVWEVGDGYRPGLPSGQREPLLQAMKAAVAAPSLAGIQASNQDIQLRFNSIPLAQYRVLWTSDLESGAWNSLTSSIPGGASMPLTNINSGTNVLVTDCGALTNAPRRFYLLQTPP
ncbi:MAG TPA: glycoside hydrolase family 18 protein [Candidatus Acidoferrum sp.]|nr:glycoside hydrolase family 18 protein [Candidatus Acidoferrum sp.]